LVPGLTDDPQNIGSIARFIAPMTNVEWVEVLPLHQMGGFNLGHGLSARPNVSAHRRTGARGVGNLSRRRLPRMLTHP
jgi:pyruvate-formate lyase-activating enzyme